MSRIHERGNGLLEGLCQATGARAALVCDESSPAVWWWAGPVDAPRHRAALENLVGEARLALGDRLLRAGARLRLCRDQEPPLGFVYSFAGIYMLVVSFEAAFNRFAVEPHLRRLLPILEQLVPHLPPHDEGRRARPRARSAALKPPSR